jgi:hypothetical protein
LPILVDYWDYLSLGDDFYRPDPEAPGSWRDLYWWRVIGSMKAEWESAKYDDDSPREDRAEMGGTPHKKYNPNAPRKQPKLPSQRRRG